MAEPVINVNLTKCGCSGGRLNAARRAGNSNPVDPLPCDAGCPGGPVLIPCPIPRAVTFGVALGECIRDPFGCRDGNHASVCFARSVKVSCSVSGETWEESQPTTFEAANRPGLAFADDVEADAVVEIVRERWALVKALVLGQAEYTIPLQRGAQPVPWAGDLLTQRDAVFSALADMARVEQAAFEAQERSIRAMGEPTFLPDNFHRAEPHARASASVLERYVERLIEQVGTQVDAPPGLEN